MKKEFEPLFEDLNQNELDEVWIKAKKEKNIKNCLFLIIILVVDFCIIYFGIKKVGNLDFSFSNFYFSFFVMPCITIDILVYIFINLLMNKNSKNYNNEFKEKIVDKLIKNFFTDVDYVPAKGISEEMYKMPKYYGYYNRYYSDDYIDAKINEKYSMKMGEIKTQKVEHHRSNGRSYTTTTTIFSGLFIRIDLQKSIETILKITRDNMVYGKEKIEMDSMEFEKYFDVGAENRISGMEILTSDVMDLLISFRKYLNEEFDIHIINNVLYIRLHIGAMFESELNNNVVVDKELVKKYYNILDFTYNLSNEIIKVIESYHEEEQ